MFLEGKTNKLNTKIKIVTFMVKKENEFFFLICKSSQRPEEGKRQDGEGRAAFHDSKLKSRPQDRLEGKSRETGRSRAFPEQLGEAVRFMVTDQKPGRGVPEAKTRKVIFHGD